MRKISINGRSIGPSCPPYVIAEISANHNGDLQKALKIIDMAADRGADAIKLQTYTPDTMTIDCQKDDFQIHGGLWDGHTLYSLYEWAQTPFEWQEAMFERARARGITVFSTPFDETAVNLLEQLQAPAYKIASFEAVDLPLIARVARTGKPMIISTGMADLREIEEAVECARDNGCKELALLHCVSGYPTPPEQSNLLTIKEIEKNFNCVVGLSDHTLGNTSAIAAIALGASLIEKHVTICREDGGPDSSFSLEPRELESLCNETKIAWQALGKAGFDRKPIEEANLVFRRSIYVVKDIAEGENITRENVRCIRPGFGLAPRHFEEVLKFRAKKSLERGDALRWEDLQ
jgi:N-acetylneuraminate synthase